MIRWNLIFTRTAILLLIGIAIWVGRDGIVRQALINSTESKIGAKVEIGQVYTSLTDDKIFVKQLTIADPREPMRNLFQADSAVLKFDRSQLLRRKFIVESGSVSQLVFGTPRTNPGAEVTIATNETGEADELDFEVQVAKKDPYEAWLDHFQIPNKEIDASKLELTKTANTVFDKLKRDLRLQLANLNNLKLTIEKVRDALKTVSDNSLRPKDFQHAQARLESTNREIETVAKRLYELDAQMASDKSALVKAKQHDEATLSRKTNSKFVDAEVLNNLLLSEQQIAQAKEVLNWYLAFRNAVPNPENDFSPPREHGKNIDLPSGHAIPDFWIKSMNLDGEGRIAGKKYNFSGTVNNFSTEPAWLDEPTSFSLRAQGYAHIVVDSTIDRTQNGHVRDEIHLICSDIPAPPKKLGDRETIEVAVSPSRSKIEIKLACVDDQLDGTLNFEYENLVTQVEHLDQMAGGIEFANRVNLELGSITNYFVKARISGSLHEPVIDFQSDLGESLVKKFNGLIKSEQTSTVRLDEILKKHLARLENEFAREIRLANEILENEILNERTKIVAELQKRSPKFSTDQSLRR